MDCIKEAICNYIKIGEDLQRGTAREVWKGRSGNRNRRRDQANENANENSTLYKQIEVYSVAFEAHPPESHVLGQSFETRQRLSASQRFFDYIP